METYDPPLFPPDEDNPYAPPSSELEPELVPLDLKQVEFSIGDVLTRTWEIYRDRMGICIGVCAVYVAPLIGAYIAAVILIAIAENTQRAVSVLMQFVAMLALMIFFIWMTIGLFRVMLDITRGREATIGGLFSGARFLWRVILAGVLYWLASVATIMLGIFLGTLLTALVMTAVHANAILQGFMMFLACLPGFVLGYVLSLRLWQFIFLIVDRDLGVLDSLRVSFRITRGHAGQLFVVYLLSNAIIFGGSLACGVGIFFTTPYAVLLNVVAYLALTGQATADPYAKGEPLAELEPL